MKIKKKNQDNDARIIYLYSMITLFESCHTGCNHICETDDWHRNQLCMEFVAGLRY